MTSPQITQYDPIKAQINELMALNAKLIFDYRDPKGSRDARSHIFTLRTKKGDVERIRKAAKVDALEYGRKVDSVAKELTTALDSAISVHQAPLDEIEAEVLAKKAEADRIEAEAKAAAEKAEQDRQAAILKAAQEAAAKALAELEAERARQREEQIRRDAADKARLEAEAKAKAEQDAARAREEAQNRAILAAEQAKLAAEREAVAAKQREIAQREQAEADAKRAAEQAKADQEAAILKAQADAARQAQEKADAEAARLASEKVRTAILAEMAFAIHEAMKEQIDPPYAAAVAIYDGKIRHVCVREEAQ